MQQLSLSRLPAEIGARVHYIICLFGGLREFLISNIPYTEVHYSEGLLYGRTSVHKLNLFRSWLANQIVSEPKQFFPYGIFYFSSGIIEDKITQKRKKEKLLFLKTALTNNFMPSVSTHNQGGGPMDCE